MAEVHVSVEPDDLRRALERAFRLVAAYDGSFEVLTQEVGVVLGELADLKDTAAILQMFAVISYLAARANPDGEEPHNEAQAREVMLRIEQAVSELIDRNEIGL